MINNMDTLLLIILLAFCIIYPPLKVYQPKIEIIVLAKHYRIYLWYNKWIDSEYKGRVYKCLFEI